MKMLKYRNTYCLFALICFTCLSSCLTSKRMDDYVATQYGNQLPKSNKKVKSDIIVNAAFTPSKSISKTVQKTSHLLPLIVYFQYDYRHTCTLNPAIPVSEFTNAISSQSSKIIQKLNGQKLELTVEQVPSQFAIVDKAYMLLFVANWDRIYVEPDFKDLVVSYKLLQNNDVVKTGKIDVKNNESNKPIWFKSWQRSTSEYLTSYNADMTKMSKDFVSQLLEQL